MSLSRVSGLSRPFYRLFTQSLRVTQAASPETPEVSQALAENGRPLVPQFKPRFNSSHITLLGEDQLRNWEMERLRVVPAHMGFYGGNPIHEDNMNQLRNVLRKYKRLPTVTANKETVQKFKFVSFEEYKERCNSGHRVRSSHFKALTETLQRLRSIDPELMPTDVTEILNKFVATSVNSQSARKKARTLDEFGRANASAKRKASKVEVSMVKGEGQVIINGRPFTDYFDKDTDRSKIGYPFEVLNQENQYNVFALAAGGGTTGQAEATMYAIAKALVIFNPLLKPRLRLAGLMTPDSRVVERKKPGKLKARKSPTWVKR